MDPETPPGEDEGSSFTAKLVIVAIVVVAAIIIPAVAVVIAILQ
jgi:hypothetical protein